MKHKDSVPSCAIGGKIRGKEYVLSLLGSSSLIPSCSGSHIWEFQLLCLNALQRVIADGRQTGWEIYRLKIRAVLECLILSCQCLDACEITKLFKPLDGGVGVKLSPDGTRIIPSELISKATQLLQNSMRCTILEALPV